METSRTRPRARKPRVKAPRSPRTSSSSHRMMNILPSRWNNAISPLLPDAAGRRCSRRRPALTMIGTFPASAAAKRRRREPVRNAPSESSAAKVPSSRVAELTQPRACAAAATQRLKGVPFSPGTCFLLINAQAAVGGCPWAAFAIAVTHWLKGVPRCPAMCRLLWSWQWRPYAFASAGKGAAGPC